jgi:hypothetical protein
VAEVPRKQRHAAAQLYRRMLAEAEYAFSYDPVPRHVAASRGRQRETFLPLSYAPGQRAESDFSHIWIDF